MSIIHFSFKISPLYKKVNDNFVNTIAERNHYIFLFINLELRIHTQARLVSLALTVEARRRKEHHPLERVTIRCTICAAAEAKMPPTFRIRSMANVATLPRT